MRPNPYRRLWATLALAGVLAGCARQAPVPANHFYRLAVAPPKTALAKPVLSGVLGVAPPVAHGLRGERAMLYVDARRPLEVRRYHYHFWVDTPPRLLQQQLIAYLRAAHVARQVVSSDSSAGTRELVTGRLLRFERLQGADGVQAVVAMELDLQGGRSGNVRRIGVYRAEVRARDRSMYASVEAFNQAVARVYAAFVRDLRQPR